MNYCRECGRWEPLNAFLQCARCDIAWAASYLTRLAGTRR